MKKSFWAFTLALLMPFTGSVHVQASVLAQFQTGQPQQIQTEQKNGITEILKIAAENRSPIRRTFGTEQNQILLERFTSTLNPDTDAAIAQEIKEKNLTSYRETKESFSITEAISDAEFFFEYLRYGYSGYDYQGGDQLFLPIRDTILTELSAMTEPITANDFAVLLAIPLMDVIKDGHFQIQGIQLLDSKGLNYFSDLLFLKDDSGRYVTMDSDQAYFAGVSSQGIETLQKANIADEIINQLQNQEYSHFMRPTVNENGILCYMIGFSSNISVDYIDIEILLQTNENKEKKPVTIPLNRVVFENYLYEMNRALFEENRIYNAYEQDGIPVLEMRSFYAPDGDESPLEQFVQDAIQYRDADYLILDIRRNGGGNSGWAVQWLRNFTGTDLEMVGLGSTITLLTDTVEATIPENYGPEAIADFQYNRSQVDGTIPYWNIHELENPSQDVELIANDTLLFVITDLAVASASENLLTFLHRTENVVLVGTNTWGIATYGNIRPIYLPNTGLEILCSYNLSVFPDLRDFEGNGFPPDLWLDTNDSCIDKIVALIKRYR